MDDAELDVWSWGVTYTPDGAWVLADELLADDQA